MKLTSKSFEAGARIPVRNAMGRPHPDTHATFADNLNPHLAWSDLPEGTKSLVLLCVDSDAPTKPDDVNQEGRTVPFDLPRADFVHWVLVDLPADAAPIEEGEFSKGVTPRGKDAGSGPRGTRQGKNDYTGWFAGDANMEGTYLGYDGPFPPWNDERVHRYHITLYALDVDRCPVEGQFEAADVKKAILGHVLGEATLHATYAIYADAREP